MTELNNLVAHAPRAEYAGGELPPDWYAPSVEGLKQARQWRLLGLVPTSSEVLHRPVQRIPEDEIACDRTRKVVQKLLRVAEEKGVMGLAANQLGIDADIFVGALETPSCYTKPTEQRAYVNATVTAKGDEQLRGFHACLSVLGGFGGLVWSPAKINLSGWKPDGTPVQNEEWAGYGASIACHEVGHLRGELYPTRIYQQGGSFDYRPPEVRPQYNARMDAELDGQQVEPWPCPVPEAQWQAMCSGAYNLEDFYLPDDKQKNM